MPNKRTINWLSLFSSNFLGVFNDNLLKNSIIFFLATWKLPDWLDQSQLISIVSGALIFPYLILSPYAGNIAVKIPKLKIFIFFKLIEMPIMVLACIAFIFENVYLAVLSVFLMGIQSCLYSPAKYSLIRDVGGEEKVAFGSGVFETMAFLGILTGTVVASVLSDLNGVLVLCVLFIFTALLGYLATRNIKVVELPVESHKQSNNPVLFLKQSYLMAKTFRNVNISVFGSSLFWLVGGMLQMNLVIHTKQVYSGSNSETGIVMAIAALAIALGCTVAAKIAGNSTGRKMLIPGLISLTFFFFILTFLKMSFVLYCICVFLLAFSGGIFQIPNLATIQKSNAGRKLSDLFAYLNLSTFVFVLLGTLLFSLTTFITRQNSFAVFGVIMSICAITLIIFLINFRSNKQKIE